MRTARRTSKLKNPRGRRIGRRLMTFENLVRGSTFYASRSLAATNTWRSPAFTCSAGKRTLGWPESRPAATYAVPNRRRSSRRSGSPTAARTRAPRPRRGCTRAAPPRARRPTGSPTGCTATTASPLMARACRPDGSRSSRTYRRATRRARTSS